MECISSATSGNLVFEHESKIESAVVRKISIVRNFMHLTKHALVNREMINCSVKLLTHEEQLVRCDHIISEEFRKRMLYLLSEEMQDIFKIKLVHIFHSELIIPPIKALSPIERENLAMIIAKQERLSLNRNEVIRIKRGTIHHCNDLPAVHSPLTFYISFKPKSKTVVICINDSKKNPMNFLGKGTANTVYSGLKIKVPLMVNSKGQFFQMQRLAVAQLTDKENIHPFDLYNIFVKGIGIHTKAHNELKSKRLPGYIAEPPVTRSRFKNNCLKVDSTQRYYHYSISELIQSGKYLSDSTQESIHVPFQERLLIAEKYFTTANSLGEIGIIHKDIKPSNIFLVKILDTIIPFLHDFGISSDNFPVGDSCSDYIYYDAAGKYGLFSHVTDMIAAMLTTCEMLFGYDLKFEGFFDLNHQVFQSQETAFSTIVFPYLNKRLEQYNLPPLKNQNFSFNLVFDYLDELSIGRKSNTLESKLIDEIKTELLAACTVINLFYQYFAKEYAWMDLMVSSCICYFTDISANEFNQLISDPLELQIQFRNAIYRRVIDQLFEVCDEKELESHSIDKNKLKNCSFEELCELFYSFAFNDELNKKSCAILDLGKTLFELADQLTSPNFVSSSANPEFFSLLCSRDPTERQRGREMGFKEFGTAKDIQMELSKIRQAYFR